MQKWRSTHLLQMLQDGMGDVMEALHARDDGGSWYMERASSCNEELLEDKEEVERVGGGLNKHTWSLELL